MNQFYKVFVKFYIILRFPIYSLTLAIVNHKCLSHTLIGLSFQKSTFKNSIKEMSIFHLYPSFSISSPIFKLPHIKSTKIFIFYALTILVVLYILPLIFNFPIINIKIVLFDFSSSIQLSTHPIPRIAHNRLLLIICQSQYPLATKHMVPPSSLIDDQTFSIFLILILIYFAQDNPIITLSLCFHNWTIVIMTIVCVRNV